MFWLGQLEGCPRVLKLFELPKKMRFVGEITKFKWYEKLWNWSFSNYKDLFVSLNFGLFQKYLVYKSDRMQPPVSSTPGEFSQPGSIVRLKFINFMQYKDTAFNCGPNLNVIIGPNGSGKSTIVNGICLGLAGKTSVLGRASSITDFIKVGEESAGTICFCL